MEFFEVINKRRSVRQFKNDPIPEEHISQILEAAHLAPSAGNSQCARFYVVKDEEIKKHLATDAGHQLFIAQAPVAIVIVADLDAVGKGYGERGRSTYALQDTAVAAENILLAATALGYGSCWVGAFDEMVATKILDLPATLRPVAILPLGISNEPTTRVPPRKKIEDVTKVV